MFVPDHQYRRRGTRHSRNSFQLFISERALGSNFMCWSPWSQAVWRSFRSLPEVVRTQCHVLLQAFTFTMDHFSCPCWLSASSSWFGFSLILSSIEAEHTWSSDFCYVLLPKEHKCWVPSECCRDGDGPAGPDLIALQVDTNKTIPMLLGSRNAIEGSPVPKCNRGTPFCPIVPKNRRN